MSLLLKLSIFLSLFLAACGFTPMYGQYGDKNVVAGLDKIEIAMVPDAAGIELRNHLIDRFYQNGYPSSPTHKLVLSPVAEQERDLDITIDSEATRKQIRLQVSMNLIDNATNASVLSRSLTAITSYNVSATQFATRISEADAREAALADLARQIETHLSLYFKK